MDVWQKKPLLALLNILKVFLPCGSRIKSKSLFFIPDSGVAALTDTYPKNSISLKDKKPATLQLERHFIVRKHEQSGFLHNAGL